MSDDKLRAADITKDRASLIISALYTCGNSLASLMPETRFIVLRALCATFLTEDEPPAEHCDHDVLQRHERADERPCT